MCLLGTAQQIHPKICTPFLKHTDTSTKPFCSKISKIKAQLIVLKIYVNCKISSLDSKIELISQNLQESLKIFQKRETKNNEIFHQNTTFLQNKLLTENEIIKSLTETQTIILEALSSFKSNQQYEGNQTNLLTCQKQHQSSIPTPSQQQKQIHHRKYIERLHSSEKGTLFFYKNQ